MYSGVQFIDYDQNACFHLIDAIRQLGFVEGGVEHSCVCAELVERKDRIDRLRYGGHTNRNIVAVLYTEACQSLGRSVNFREQLSVGNLLTKVKQCRIGQMILITFVDVFPDRTFRQRGVNSLLRVIFQPRFVDGRVASQVHAHFLSSNLRCIPSRLFRKWISWYSFSPDGRYS